MPKLKDLATIRSGFKVLESDYRESGLRVLTAGDIKDTFSIIITENRFVEASESRMNHLLEQGDILMVSVGSKIGNSAIFSGNEPAIANQNLIVIKPFIDSQELLEKIIDNHSIIRDQAKGVGLQSISIKDLLDLDLY